MTNLVGRTLGRYQIVGLLGEGGMATVYRAFDTRLGRYVALKVLHPVMGSDASLLRRFEAEARALAQMAHPAIVRVLDYGEENATPYLVLEYVAGGTLKDRLAAQNGRPLPWREALRLLAPVARALEYAHQRGIIHRDVKPSNILLSEAGEPMLSDFGIAKTLQSAQPPDLTGTGTRMGTPDYMSPEQCTGQPVDFRTDIYSLGVVLYEMLTAVKPFSAETPLATMHRQVYDPLPPPTQYAPALPKAVEALLYRALAKNPNDRFDNMGQFAAALESLQGAPESAPTQPPARVPAQTQVSPQPHRVRGERRSLLPRLLIVGLVAAALLALVVLAAVARPLIERLPGILRPTIVDLFGTPQPTSPPNETAAPDEPTPTLAPNASTDWQQGRLVYIQRQEGTNGVYLRALDSDDARPLFVSPGKQSFGAAWSPDGTRVAFYIYPGDLRVQNADDENSAASIGNCNVPAWSPDGERILCRDPNRSVFMIYDANGGGLVEQISFAGGAVPAWSPTRRDEIAFAVFQGDSTSIWRMSLSTQETDPLAENASENYAPAWSPDGEQIAYQSNQGSDQSEIWVMNRDGSNARRVTNTPGGAWSRAPAWSPDGLWLAFVSSQAGSIGPDYGEIFVVSLESGQVIQVSSTGGTVYDWRVGWAR